MNTSMSGPDAYPLKRKAIHVCKCVGFRYSGFDYEKHRRRIIFLVLLLSVV